MTINLNKWGIQPKPMYNNSINSRATQNNQQNYLPGTSYNDNMEVLNYFAKNEVYGNQGNDNLHIAGGDNRNYANMGSGDDHVYLRANNTQRNDWNFLTDVNLGTGNDYVDAVKSTNNHAELHGGEGNDKFRIGGDGNRTGAHGGAGNDDIFVSALGNSSTINWISGGDGYDTVSLEGTAADYRRIADDQNTGAINLVHRETGAITTINRDVEQANFSSSSTGPSSAFALNIEA